MENNTKNNIKVVEHAKRLQHYLNIIKMREEKEAEREKYIKENEKLVKLSDPITTMKNTKRPITYCDLYIMGLFNKKITINKYDKIYF